MSRLTRDGTAKPVSRDQLLRRERGQGNIHFPCSADHEPDWQPYLVDLGIYLLLTLCYYHHRGIKYHEKVLSLQTRAMFPPKRFDNNLP